MKSGRKSEIQLLMKEIRKRMSENGGIIRTREAIKDASDQAYQMLKGLNEKISASTVKEIASGFRLVDHCLTHYLYLEAIRVYIEAGGRSRGSGLVAGGEETLTEEWLEKGLRFTVCGYDRDIENRILEISFRDGRIHEKLTDVRQIPEQELWFETVWKKNLEDNLTEC
jgi:succinate dehydrogenase/fumarate reductase flavoprotein subunit